MEVAPYAKSVPDIVEGYLTSPSPSRSLPLRCKYHGKGCGSTGRQTVPRDAARTHWRIAPYGGLWAFPPAVVP
eukprot:3940702-Rhodomonas_salina.2